MFAASSARDSTAALDGRVLTQPTALSPLLSVARVLRMHSYQRYSSLFCDPLPGHVFPGLQALHSSRDGQRGHRLPQLQAQERGIIIDRRATSVATVSWMRHKRVDISGHACYFSGNCLSAQIQAGRYISVTRATSVAAVCWIKHINLVFLPAISQLRRLTTAAITARIHWIRCDAVSTLECLSQPDDAQSTFNT